MKITLKEVRPYTTKTGKQMYFIKTVDDKDYSTFEDLSNWKEGQELEGEIVVSEKINPKTEKPYESFKYPRRDMYKEMDELMEKVKKLEEAVFAFDDNKSDESTESRTDDEINIDDIPF